jgi:putative redox protein
MVQIDLFYQGGLRCKAVHGPSQQSLITDAPVDNHGKGEFFSPTDLMATALGSCLATVMGIIADKEGIDLAGLKVTVKKEMAPAPRRRIGKLSVQVFFPIPLTDDQKARMERTAHYCPVHESLHPDIEMPMEFFYPA